MGGEEGSKGAKEDGSGCKEERQLEERNTEIISSAFVMDKKHLKQKQSLS